MVTTGLRYLHVFALQHKKTSLNVPQLNYKALTCVKTGGC